MKTIKSLITLLLLAVCTVVEAQTVVIEKTDGTKDEYNLSEVDSVAYVPETEYYYYLGSSDDWIDAFGKDPATITGSDPITINTSYSGLKTATSMPDWNHTLGSEIGVDASKDGYTWIILPTEWFNNLTVLSGLNSPITWESDYIWTCTINGINYTMVWGDVTARLLYFTFAHNNKYWIGTDWTPLYDADDNIIEANLSTTTESSVTYITDTSLSDYVIAPKTATVIVKNPQGAEVNYNAHDFTNSTYNFYEYDLATDGCTITITF